MPYPRPISPELADAQLEQLKQLRRAEAGIAGLHQARVDEARARKDPAPEWARQPSPGLPRHRYQNPRTYVVEADVAQLGRNWRQHHRAELEQLRDAFDDVHLSPTALVIAAAHLPFRGARPGREGCGLQLSLEAWGRLTGSCRRMVAYAFAQLEAVGWVRRHRRLVNHEWTDELGHTWKRADVRGASYLTTKAAVQLQRRGQMRRGGRLVRVGLVGKLLELAGKKLRAVFRRVSAAWLIALPPLERSASKALNQERRRAKGAPPTGPPGHPSTAGEKEHRGTADRDRGRASVGGGSPNLTREQLLQLGSASAAWPVPWSTGDELTRQWLHREYIRQTTSSSPSSRPKRSPAQRAAGRTWLQRRGKTVR